MPRAKTGTVRRAKHKKDLKQAKGYWGLRSKSFKVAQQTLLKLALVVGDDRSSCLMGTHQQQGKSQRQRGGFDDPERCHEDSACFCAAADSSAASAPTRS